MENLERKFEEIGLSGKEASVYLALLKVGRGTAYKISKLAGVKTPTTYLMLDELLKKGLALKIPHAKSRIYIAKTPDEYLEEQKNKLRAFEAILPQVMSLASQKDESKVITFDGYDGIKNALEYKIDTMKDKKFFSFYSHLPSPDEKVLKIFDDWNRKAIKNSITFKTIMPDAPGTFDLIDSLEKKYLNSLKLIDMSLWSSEISIEIAEDFVRIMSTKDLQATVVDNKKVSHAMKQIFNMVWDSGIGKTYKGNIDKVD